MGFANTPHQVDTRNILFDPTILKDYGFAISAGKTLQPLEHMTPSVRLEKVSKRAFDEIVNWLRHDFERNRTLIESVLLEIADSESYDRLQIINSERLLSRLLSEFKSDITNLTSVILTGVPLVPSQDTIQLAQRVAEMEPDTRSVRKWAESLTSDISERND